MTEALIASRSWHQSDEPIEGLCPACHKITGWRSNATCVICGYDDVQFWVLIREICSLSKQMPIVAQALQKKAFDIREDGCLFRSPVAAQIMEFRRDLAFMHGLVVGSGR